jgi:hypothetical protein
MKSMPLIAELQDAFIKAMRIADALVAKTEEAQELENDANEQASRYCTALYGIRDLFNVPDENDPKLFALWMKSKGNTEALFLYVKAQVLLVNYAAAIASEQVAIAATEGDFARAEITRLNTIITSLKNDTSALQESQNDVRIIRNNGVRIGWCSRCGVNRFNAPCPNTITQCPMVGIAGTF